MRPATLAHVLATASLFCLPGLAPAAACRSDNGGLSLPPGFCATVFADGIGHARHLAMAPNGVLYVNTWSGNYYTDKSPPAGGFFVALKDSHGTGTADVVQRFGAGAADGSTGGTGLRYYRGALYVEQNDKILRYPLAEGEVVPHAAAEVVLSGMPLGGDHPMHPFIIDDAGHLYIDMGSSTNACDEHNRMPKTRGHLPCTELETRAGIWRYDANRTGQVFSAAGRYATGLRNGEGMAFDSAGRLFVTQHGRDQLGENFQDLYTAQQGHELPAEEIVLLEKGGDYGWPACYFDGFQKKLVLAPEYGGDGGKTVGICADKRGPVAFYPAHWGPNALFVYSGTQFPAPYRGGAFIAFHGSWNRAPAPQAGYNVVFQPLKDGRATGDYLLFADGFAGREKAPGRAAFRPSGLAQGNDGALYVADDAHGRIWRITYEGDPALGVALAAPPAVTGHGDSRPLLASLVAPTGVSRDELLAGEKIFHGEQSGGTCAGCHASDGKGSEVGINLTTGHWKHSNGSLAGLEQTITKGVMSAGADGGVMPPYGGAKLSRADVRAVAAYVWALGHAATP